MPDILANLDLTGTGYCASLNFRRTSRTVTRMYDTAMQESGVRSTQFAILVGIAKLQPVAMGTLADVLMLDSSTLTRSLKLLEKEGMIEKSKRAADAPTLSEIDALRRKGTYSEAYRCGGQRTQNLSRR